MKTLLAALIIAASSKGGGKMVDQVLQKITWLGHASFLINYGKVIYIDPWKLKTGLPPADIILITHDHYDHCSPEDVRKIQTKNTSILAGGKCASKLSGDVTHVIPGQKYEKKGITIETVPAYNIAKFFHPRSSKYVGFIITVNGVKIYHAGDTDFIPEMKNIKVDIALLPVGGTYTMDAREAAEAANTIKPAVAIPMHWGDIIGTAEDAETFRKLAKTKVVILSPYR